MKWYVTVIETRVRRGIFNEVEAPTREEAERLVKQERVQPDEIDTLQYSLEVEGMEETV